MVRAKEIYYPNSEKPLLYFPTNGNRLILKKVSPDADIYEDSTTVITKIYNSSLREVKVEYIFENDPSSNYKQVYNFVNDKWVLYESK